MKYKISKYLQISILLLSVLVFTPSLNGDFLNWDDTTYITDNELLTEDIGFSSFKKIYDFDAYISLSLFSFQLQTKIFGNSTFYFHMINILIHLINIFLVFYITKILFRDKIASFWIALVFAIHPYNAESVAWIMQRKDLLFTMFYLSATILYIKFIKTDKIVFYLITILLAYLAILSKVAAITLVFTLLLVEFYLTHKIALKSLLLLLIIGLAQISYLTFFSSIFAYAAIPLIIISVHNKLYKSQLLENKTFHKKNIIKDKFGNLLLNPRTIDILIISYLIVFLISNLSTLENIIIKPESTLSTGLILNLITYFLPVLILYILNDRNQKRIAKFIAYIKSPWIKTVVFLTISALALTFIYFESIPKFEQGEFSVTNIISLKTLFYFAYSLIFYILGFIFPFYQNSMHPYPEGETFSFLFKLAPIILIGISFLVFYFIKKMKDKTLQRKTIFGILFFLINISIVLHIIPIKGRVIVAERYSYLAYLGLIIVMVFLIKQIFTQCKLTQKRTILFFVLLLLSGYSIQTYARSKVFKNSFSFWSDIIDKNPENHYAVFALGLHYYEKNNYATAINYYSKAINISPENYEYYLNRGSSYLKIDSNNLALNDYDIAIELHADNFVAYKNRGILYYEIGNLENAKNDLEKALKINPNDKEVSKFYNTINTLLKEYQDYQIDGKSSSIVSQYFFRLASNLATKGKHHESLPFFDESIKLDSSNVNAYKNRGNVFAMLQRFEESINDYENALKIDTLDAGIYLNLGNVLHQSGSLKSACNNWQKALDLGKSEAQKTIDMFCK